jgi:hypothetical protein
MISKKFIAIMLLCLISMLNPGCKHSHENKSKEKNDSKHQSKNHQHNLSNKIRK